jgi:hypothetical protein
MTEQHYGFKRSIPAGESWGGCRACKHLQPGGRCIAFPDRIPLAIFAGDVDHLVARPGQVGGTVFEIADEPSELARRRIRAGVARGEAWARAALEKIEPISRRG